MERAGAHAWLHPSIDRGSRGPHLRVPAAYVPRRTLGLTVSTGLSAGADTGGTALLVVYGSDVPGVVESWRFTALASPGTRTCISARWCSASTGNLAGLLALASTERALSDLCARFATRSLPAQLVRPARREMHLGRAARSRILSTLWRALLDLRLADQSLVGLSRVLVGGLRVFHLRRRLMKLLLLRPALIHALEAPFDAAPRRADRLAADQHEDRIGVRRRAGSAARPNCCARSSRRTSRRGAAPSATMTLSRRRASR